MLGAKYDFSRDRERRAGIDDMVYEKKKQHLFILIHLFFNLGFHVQEYRLRNKP
jgi:hypothetical protein